jgi:PEP-CTERM motif
MKREGKMGSRSLIAAMALLITAGQIHIARADIITSSSLPVATYNVDESYNFSVAGAYGAASGSATGGSYQYLAGTGFYDSGSGLGWATFTEVAQINGLASLSASVAVIPGGVYTGGDNEAFSQASESYSIEILGPTPSVNLDIEAVGALVGPGAGYEGTGVVFEVEANERVAYGCAGGPIFAGCSNPGSSFDAGGVYSVPTNTPIGVGLEANIEQFGAVGITTATVDPSFTIDPDMPDAADYSIVYSTGLPASVPEPGTLGLLAAGLIGVVAARRGKTRVPFTPAHSSLRVTSVAPA